MRNGDGNKDSLIVALLTGERDIRMQIPLPFVECFVLKSASSCLSNVSAFVRPEVRYSK